MTGKNSEAFDVLSRLSGEGVALVDGVTRRVVDANAAFSALAGLERGELQAASVAERLETPGDAPGGWIAQPRGSVQAWFRPARGPRVPVEARWERLGEEGHVLLVVRDRRPQLEAEALSRSVALVQRTQALGQMASGIAHDFNNTLMATLPWADLIGRKYPEDETIAKAADQIRRAVHRAKEITRQLLDFAQPRPAQKTRVPLGDLVRKQMKMIRPALPPEIGIEVEVEEEVTVDADGAQIGQILLNLALNARDAMPAGGLFTVTVRPPAPEESEQWNADPATCVVVSVRDTGHGIPAKDHDAIFDPFFTTKEMGKGPGLGLPVVVRLVEQHGGSIHVESEPGRGTCFHIVLPRAAASAPAPERRGDAAMPRLAGRTVVLVDDEASVLEGLRLLLELEGASVEAYARGADAIERLMRKPAPDLLILDLGMPQIGGREVHRIVRRRLPDLPILVSSGYGDAERIDDLLLSGPTAYRQKPYDAEALFAAVESLLDPTANDERRTTDTLLP